MEALVAVESADVLMAAAAAMGMVKAAAEEARTVAEPTWVVRTLVPALAAASADEAAEVATPMEVVAVAVAMVRSVGCLAPWWVQVAAEE